MNLPEIGLFGILILVFTAPFLFKSIEHNLEIFLFAMGCLAVSITGSWNMHLVSEAFREPLPISSVVLGAGLLFKWSRKKLESGIQALLTRIPLSIFIFLLIVLLGVLSSIITAIIAALILVEVISILKLDRTSEIHITIIACFSIGLGAALTPIGEPLSTIVVAKLHQDFWYLFKNFGILILPPIFVLGFFAPLFHKPSKEGLEATSWKEEDSIKSVIIRALKVYVFVMALLFLGAGFKSLINTYLIVLSSGVLFWLNMASAVLDNAICSRSTWSARGRSCSWPRAS